MILVTGSNGFLGKGVCRLLKSKNIFFEGISRSHGPDLLNRISVIDYFNQIKPEKVIHCASYIGGIKFGISREAEIFHNNLHMTLNLFEASNLNKIKRIVNPISNCAYPASSTFFKEDEFWNGPLHDSVMVYGMVRKLSWVGARAYARQYNLDTINLILSNMYGPDDYFDEERSHALGALIMKIVNAKNKRINKVIIWGSGKPVREWLHVDDAAEAMVRALDVTSNIDPINIGIGKGISIWELANMIKELVQYEGELVLDKTKPDGAFYKTVDGSRAAKHFGWVPQREFKNGVEETIEWYKQYGQK